MKNIINTILYVIIALLFFTLLSAQTTTILKRRPSAAGGADTTLIASCPPLYYNDAVPMHSATYTGLGQSFTGNGMKLVKCTFYLKSYVSGYYCRAKLYSHSGTYGSSSVPSSLLATSSDVDVGSIPTSNTLISFYFDGTYTLVNDTHYVIVFEFTGGDSGHYLTCGWGYGIADGNYSIYLNSWNAVSNRDVIFYVYGL